MRAKKKVRVPISSDGKLLAAARGEEALQALAETDSNEEIEIEIFPQILGGAKTPTLTGPPGEFLRKPLDYRMTSMKVVDGRCLATFRRVSVRAY